MNLCIREAKQSVAELETTASTLVALACARLAPYSDLTNWAGGF